MKLRLFYMAVLVSLCVFLVCGCVNPTTGWEHNEHGIIYRGENGKPVTGWYEIDGTRYHFSENGLMCTGWLETDDGLYFLGENGAIVTGWLQLDGVMYFFDDNGANMTGWVTSRGMLYYLTENGPLTGWQEIDEKRYYFQESGVLLTGWAELSGNRYYFNEQGQSLTGWQKLDGQQYHFSEDGILTLGWYSENGYDYYFKPNGAMAVGPTEINSSIRYFSPNGVHIWLVNPWNSVPDNFVPDLKYIDKYYLMDVSCYDALLQMLSDCRSAGHFPMVVSGYRTQDVQVYLFEEKVNYYLNYGYSLEDARREASKTIAIPGTSEHQIGLAVDIIDAFHTKMDNSQADTATQKWLMEHCHEYGFILRYPEGTTNITGIIYEPWHYRYVGVEIATEIMERGITLEEYLNAVVTD